MNTRDAADVISITAEREEVEAFRVIRLHRIVGYIAALASRDGIDLLPRLAGLRDSKGELQVTWRTQPSDAEKALVVEAWRSGVGDGADTVAHHISPAQPAVRRAILPGGI